MFSFFRKKLVSEIEQQPPLELPLSNIQKIDQAGILYVDNEGTSTNINYYETSKIDYKVTLTNNVLKI